MAEPDSREVELVAEALEQAFVDYHDAEHWHIRFEVLARAAIAALSAHREAEQLTAEEAKALLSWVENVEEFEDCGCVECRALAKLRRLAGGGPPGQPTEESE